MQWFNNWFIVCKLVTWNINHWAYKSCVVLRMHINLRAWEWDILQGLLHLRSPFLHEIVNVRHLLRIIHSWRWSCLMQILDIVDPSWNFLRLFVCLINWLNIHRLWFLNVTFLNVSHFKHCLIVLIQSRFVKDGDTKVFFGTIRLRHFQESVHFSYTWNILRDERLHLCVKIYFLRLIPLNVFKELLDITSNL